MRTVNTHWTKKKVVVTVASLELPGANGDLIHMVVEISFSLSMLHNILLVM